MGVVKVLSLVLAGVALACATPSSDDTKEMDVCADVQCKETEFCMPDPNDCDTAPCPQYACVPFPPNPCDDVQCRDVEVCMPEPQECETTPCPQYVCVVVVEDPCAGVECEGAGVCLPEPQQCETTPCPQYICTFDPCVPSACKENEDCIPEPQECETAPCPQYTCLPGLPDPCADAECKDTEQCVPDFKECLTTPCPQYACVLDLCSNAECKETELCVPEPKECSTTPCPQYTCVPDIPDPCLGVICEETLECVPEFKECLTTPCPQYACRPVCPIADCPEIECASALVIQKDEYGCRLCPVCEDEDAHIAVEGAEWSTCASACPATCADPNPGLCIDMCVDGYVCLEKGHVIHLDRCILPSDCPTVKTITCDDNPCAETESCTPSRLPCVEGEDCLQYTCSTACPEQCSTPSCAPPQDSCRYQGGEDECGCQICGELQCSESTDSPTVPLGNACTEELDDGQKCDEGLTCFGGVCRQCMPFHLCGTPICGTEAQWHETFKTKCASTDQIEPVSEASCPLALDEAGECHWQCKPVQCKMHCEYGWAVDPHTQCETCACRDPPKVDPNPTGTEPSTTLTPKGSTVTAEATVDITEATGQPPGSWKPIEDVTAPQVQAAAECAVGLVQQAINSIYKHALTGVISGQLQVVAGVNYNLVLDMQPTDCLASSPALASDCHTQGLVQRYSIRFHMNLDATCRHPDTGPDFMEVKAVATDPPAPLESTAVSMEQSAETTATPFIAASVSDEATVKSDVTTGSEATYESDTETPVLVGGWTSIANLDAPHVMQAAQCAAGLLQGATNSVYKYALARIVSGKQQVVAGINYDMIIETQPTDCLATVDVAQAGCRKTGPVQAYHIRFHMGLDGLCAHPATGPDFSVASVSSPTEDGYADSSNSSMKKSVITGGVLAGVGLLALVVVVVLRRKRKASYNFSMSEDSFSNPLYGMAEQS